MPRHFYLRQPVTNFPCTSVVTVEVATNATILVAFAVAVCNPKDKFSRSYGKNRALGLLNIPIEKWKETEVLQMTLPAGTPGLEVKRAVVESIAHGRWAELHPAAALAHQAAQHWLETHPVGSHTDLCWEGKTRTQCPQLLSQEEVRSVIGVPPEEPVVFTTADEPSDTIERVEDDIISQAVGDGIVHPHIEDIEILVHPNDQAALDRIFGPAHD